MMLPNLGFCRESYRGCVANPRQSAAHSANVLWPLAGANQFSTCLLWTSSDSDLLPHQVSNKFSIHGFEKFPQMVAY